MTDRPIDSDRRMGHSIRAWLLSEADFVPDRDSRIDHVLEQIDQTKQRRRWWPLIPFGRRAVHSARATDRVSAGIDVTRRRRGPRPTRRSLSMLSPIRLIATLAIIALVSSALLYRANPPPPSTPGGMASTLAADTTLLDKSSESWNTNDRALFDEVYAPDAVHRVSYHDRLTVYEGRDAIARVAMYPSEPIGLLGERVALDPLGWDARYLSVSELWGGTICVFAIKEQQITRQDCIAPKAFNDRPFTASDSDLETWSLEDRAEDHSASALEAWNEDDRALLEETYAEDAVLTSVFLDGSRVSEGIDEIEAVASLNTLPMTQLVEPIVLPAPEGEFRWAGVTDLGGGTVCGMWMVGSQIARHDCLVPSMSPFRD